MTDEQLMLAVKAGNLDRMSVLFERYHKRLYNFFYKVNYNQLLSEDLTQNVFEKIIRYRNSYSQHYAFKSWMFQIARNARIEHFKKYGSKRTEDLDLSHLDLGEDTVSIAIDKQEQMVFLKKAMTQLNEEQREILMLTRYQGMKYRAVGTLLGCSEGAVKVKVYRAIKQLRQIYLQYL